MRFKNNKLLVIINTITIFLSMFLFSFVYEKFPNFLTASIFPVNESLFEHLKLIYVTMIIISIIVYFIFKARDIKINNYFSGLLLTTILNIGLYFVIFLPIYNRFGENIIFTMGLYLVILIITEYVFYLIMNLKQREIYNYISLILIPIIWLSLVYFTFNPRHNDFFYDTIAEKYGINEYRK